MLKLEQVYAGYGKATVLHGISLEIGPGEVVALVGPNGAGKSTTIRCITGEVKVRQGFVSLNDRNLAGLAPYEVVARGISCSPEGRQVFGNLTVYDNLRMGAFALKDRSRMRGNIDRVFSLFPRLAERRRQYAESLSGGEQQMLAIGRAVMNDPELLLLDEPSLGIAPVIVDSIYEKITEISQSGTAVLVVEQNVGMALDISSRAYVMESGQIHLAGPSADLMNNPYILDTYMGVK
ncbi:ABC transporter ATP-binding protein [Desulfovibrio sp. OttesenSCG-928-C14]|nr:ABC transporter ATP-binding protein [Desulfovibrio sp. OttesenSCG-928-C14]